jgi:iron complex transport system ATP-binding protein
MTAGELISLSCRQLDVSIAGVQVVKQLQLEMAAGSFWAVLGANGAGKTTLLTCLAGLRPMDHGTVELSGEDVHTQPRRHLARRLSMLQQHSAYVFDSTVLQAALTGRHPHLGWWEREHQSDFNLVQEALARVDLQGFEHRRVTSLSGGEARRLAFATLLVQETPVILLDEPSNHLDLRHQLQIMQLARELTCRPGIAIAALHDVNLAMAYCSHALLLLGSGEWLAGPIAEVISESSLERTYGCAVEQLQGRNGARFYPLAAPGTAGGGDSA